MDGSSFAVANEFDKAITLWKADKTNLDNDLKSKEAIENRVMDLYRNNDTMRGLVEKMVDSIVGARVQLQCTPDYETLGVTREDAQEWAKTVEREFHLWADSPENWISANRTMDFTQIMRQAYRGKIFTGEMTASREWRKSPLGYSTCFNVFSSGRMKQPKGQTANRVFHGVELDRFGAAIAYHIEEATAGQKKNFGRKKTKRYAKYNSFGWMQLFHVFEPLLAEYPRGISRLTSVLKKLKQIDRFNEADLDKAIITTAYVFAITSDEDPESVADMLSGASALTADARFNVGESGVDLPQDITDKRKEILEQITGRYVKTHGGQIAHLFKGEDMKTVSPPNTIQTSADFVKGHTRSVSNGMGVSYEFGSGDFDGVSFAGGQMSLGIYEHSANVERKLYVHKFGKYLYRSWLAEAIDKGRVPTINGISYWENLEAYSKCTFTGTKRIQSDQVKAANANRINLANGTTSRTEIVAENGGDLESVMLNRSSEARIILKAAEEIATEAGIKLTDEAKMQIVLDVLATSNVDVTEVLVEKEEV